MKNQFKLAALTMLLSLSATAKQFDVNCWASTTADGTIAEINTKVDSENLSKSPIVVYKNGDVELSLKLSSIPHTTDDVMTTFFLEDEDTLYTSPLNLININERQSYSFSLYSKKSKHPLIQLSCEIGNQ